MYFQGRTLSRAGPGAKFLRFIMTDNFMAEIRYLTKHFFFQILHKVLEEEGCHFKFFLQGATFSLKRIKISFKCVL